jgi:hypothetical protein
MSFPIAPRPTLDGTDPGPPSPALLKSRKISTACGACKQRKTRVSGGPSFHVGISLSRDQCTGGHPCDACATRHSECIYDAAADQRRKIANQRNMQELAEAQLDLTRCRELLGGMISIMRAGSLQSTNDLVDFVRTGIDLSSLAAYVRNEVRASMAIEQSFHEIDFNMNNGLDLPSPSQLLNRMDSAQSMQPHNQQLSHPESESTSTSTSNYAAER